MGVYTMRAANFGRLHARRNTLCSGVGVGGLVGMQQRLCLP